MPTNWLKPLPGQAVMISNIPEWWALPELSTKFRYRPPNLHVKVKRSMKRDFTKSYTNQKVVVGPIYHQFIKGV